MRACADPKRPHGWIDDSFVGAYSELHRLGWAHSIETWQDDELVGGLYGVSICGLFAGESMFHRATDASKVALVNTVELLNAGDAALFDVQWVTPHLESLGAVEIRRPEYGRRVADAIERTLAMLRGEVGEPGVRPADVLTQGILSSRGRTIRPKTLNQKRYVDAIDRSTITFGIGPAGTGKTYLAVAKGVQALQAKQVTRIILTRPAVEAGERLGFLPGTLFEKIDPYLRPLYDALHDMIDPESIPRLMAAGTIEVAPLAYMRGRSLNDAFIILDEAQNTSPEQMKMFLTRLGFGSQMVVTGDVTQIDLPSGTQSGLKIVQSILDGLDDVHFAMLTSHDVVRHRLVSAIVDAYGRWDAAQQAEDLAASCVPTWPQPSSDSRPSSWRSGTARWPSRASSSTPRGSAVPARTRGSSPT